MRYVSIRCGADTTYRILLDVNYRRDAYLPSLAAGASCSLSLAGTVTVCVV